MGRGRVPLHGRRCDLVVHWAESIGQHWTRAAAPIDPNVAWVAAVGNLWKPNAERGVFKTTDAGRTWTKSLYVDSLTGANEVAMDPRDPNVLYASTYQRLRTVYGFNGGGPGSALWKSTDGGATWRKIENGIPAGEKGRIGIAVAKSNPNVVIATVEHQTGSGLYRSDDAGANWRRTSSSNPRPMYYSHPFIDPTTDQRVWLMGVQPMKSEDGGTTFDQMPNAPTYDLGLKDDHHVLWVDPRDSRHLLLGGDGGLHESWDLGYTYNRLNGFAIAQFYRIAVDNRDPYFIYGGLQDAHSWMGPSATNHWLGILNSDWKQIGFSDGTGQAVDKRVTATCTRRRAAAVSPAWMPRRATGMRSSQWPLRASRIALTGPRRSSRRRTPRAPCISVPTSC